VDPVCLSPESTLRDLRELKKKCGFSGIPITDSGKLGTKLKGIVTSRDVDFLDDDSMDRLLSDVSC
jgi:IMP dehydrogenase